MADDLSSRQANLFADFDSAVVYEQPLNERMRTCLRLEHLFDGIECGILGGNEWSSREALVRMLEVCDFMVRTDVKGELIKELERNVTVLEGLRGKPGVSENALDDTVTSVGTILSELKQPAYQPGSRLRQDELANLVKQRSAIPGGSCNFDVPAFHYWLSAPAKIRGAQLSEWMRDLRAVEKATSIILRLIRESNSPRKACASGGFYQEQLDNSQVWQLVRIIVQAESGVYPEISGGKHRFTVRFYAQHDTAARPGQVSDDVDFELQCCSL